MYSIVLYHPLIETYYHWKIIFSLVELAETLIAFDAISRACSNNYVICILEDVDIRDLSRDEIIEKCKDYLKKEEEKYGRV